MKIIMLGAPGAGKGTQAQRIVTKYGIPQISTGDIFRYNIKENTELGKKLKSFVDNGKLVPDEVVVEVVVDRLKKDDCKNGYILDGFPRTIPQAKALDDILASENSKIDFCIDVEVPYDNIINRMSGRRTCTGCGSTYNTVFSPTKEENICDKCGDTTIQREDDKEEIVKNRLEVYDKETKPLIDYYKEKGNLYVIDGTKSMDEVFENICNLLGN